MSCPSFRPSSNPQTAIPVPNPKPDQYANLETAYAKSDHMIKFQHKLQEGNDVYEPSEMSSAPQVPPVSQTTQHISQPPSASNTNMSVKQFIHKKNENIAPVRKHRHNRSAPEVFDQTIIDELSGALFTPVPTYPHIYPLYRDTRFDAYATGSNLLERFGDDDGSSTGMGLFRAILWIVLILAIIYGFYYLYTEQSNSGDSGSSAIGSGIFHKNTFKKKYF